MAEKHPPATRKDHEAFCVAEGWTERKRATGKRGTHHVNFEFALPDGRVLFTRISHPVDRTDYGPSMCAHILRDQLQVTAEEFWACVSGNVLPDRGIRMSAVEAIPLSIIKTLVGDARMSESEVRAMSKDEAIKRLNDFYTTGR